MGSKDTYRYINENPRIEFRTIDYTNSPLTIARQKGMTAINSALEIDLTGQATAESIGQRFYSGVGGQADFMRGAALAKGGKTIIALPSTTSDASTSRIVPFLKEGAGVTITRGDVMYVVTEFGIAYLRGKSIHERALALISIASPAFQPWLIKEAKRQKLIFPDQEFIAGSSGIYPEALETYRTTRKGLFILLRPVKISDQPLLKEFLYSLSEESRYNRFISARRDIPRKMLLELTVIDYTKKSVILALIQKEGSEEIVGLGQYEINPDSHTAEVALAVRDDNQNMGVGRELLSYLTHLAKKAGLLGFTAEVLEDNDPVFRLFNKMGYQVTRNKDYGVYMMRAVFN
jgi:ribosomal protein S18 acetylase RimI-like enzyme